MLFIGEFSVGYKESGSHSLAWPLVACLICFHNTIQPVENSQLELGMVY
jgi:hypothetical protein